MQISPDIYNLPIPERVRALCNLFYARGEKVSVRTILQHIPDVKSTSTIHKYYREWKQEIDSQQTSMMERLGGFSEEFSTIFMREVNRFSIEAENRYKSQADDALDQCRQAIDDLTRADDRVYKQNMVVEQLEAEIKTLRTGAAEANKAATATLEEVRNQIEELKIENRRLLDANEKLITEVAKGQLAVEHSERFVQEVRSQHLQLSGEFKSQTTELTETNRLLTQRVTEAEGLRALIDQLRNQEKNQAATLETEQANHRIVQGDLRHVRQEFEALQREKAILTERVVTIEKQLEASNRTVTEQAAVILLLGNNKSK